MSAPGKTFGVRKDGTLGLCKAKPENQGKGNCFHEKHVKLSTEELKTDVIKRYNEEALNKFYSAKRVNGFKKRGYPSKVTANRIQTHEGGKILSREELELGAAKVAERFNNKDWTFIKEFYNKYDRVMSDEERNETFKTNPADNIKDYLESDDPTAEKLREFLGNEVDIEEFSEIIVQQGGAMTKVKRWHPKAGVSIRRCILTSLNNDMTKERYIASVVFFGGRCCYCNKPLRKDPPKDRQASGEHITPVTPENPNDSPGGTRYGNMALACVNCNGDRGNTELTEWISKTSCIKPENKEKALGRINAFREFALYSEYSQEESKKIDDAAIEIREHIETHRNRSGILENQSELIHSVNDKLMISVFNLQHGK